MSLQAVRNVVLLFSNPSWSNGHSVPSTIIRNITALSSQIAYSEDYIGNITTLSTNYVPTSNGVIQGLLYVPDLNRDDSCYDLANEYIPANVTRQANLPTTNYKLIAIAPWISIECTRSFLASARSDPLRAMLVYLPGSGATQPPDADSLEWDLNDGDAWKSNNHYPVYAVTGAAGEVMMEQLSLYSGDLSEVPFASQINTTYSPNPDDYVRVWTELTVATKPSTLSLWAFVLIIIGVLLIVIGGTSLLMHCVQNRRRAALRRRVMRGEVNLEALGIKRLSVPMDHIQTFPLFTYNYDPPVSSPTSPKSLPISLAKTRSEFDSKATTSRVDKAEVSLHYQPTCLICLEDFESKKTIIRELSCGHIFHPECIDEFLSELSSLCPLCKASMLPPGHCPKITNSMVRREVGTRRLRSRSVISDVESGRRRLASLGESIKKYLSRTPPPPKPDEPVLLQEQPAVLQEQPVLGRPAPVVTTRDRMQELVEPIDETNSDDGRPLC
ncbi:hypothetical protein F5X96DRAFT_664128 [Biscogniauxia mediterranea]|nr:hypothetical protein F5X96DRAFT_664128 [Biscogniauxia mediterranea]